MRKEDLAQRIAQHRQQLISDETAENTRIKEQQATVLENSRLVEQRRKQEIENRIAKTKENFQGSQLIETLEEIRDSQILFYEKTPKGRSEKTFLGSKWVNYIEVTPAKIEYETDTVRLIYDKWYIRGHGDYDEGSSSGHYSIIIKKTSASIFEFRQELTRTDNGKSEDVDSTTGDTQAVIDRIALAIAESQIREQKKGQQ